MARPELGNKHECNECDAKFYDLMRPEPKCPKCGHAVSDKPTKKKAPRVEPKPVEDELDASTDGDDIDDLELDNSGAFDEDDDDLGVEEVNLSEENAEAMLGQLSSREDGDDDLSPSGGAMDDIDDDDDFDSDVSYAGGDDDDDDDEDEDEDEDEDNEED